MTHDRQDHIRRQQQLNYENTTLQLSHHTELVRSHFDWSTDQLKSFDRKLDVFQEQLCPVSAAVSNLANLSNKLPGVFSSITDLVRLPCLM
jgi:hypothetical protein